MNNYFRHFIKVNLGEIVAAILGFVVLVVAILSL